MENDILDSLNDLCYDGPLSDEAAFAKALEGGHKSLEYTKLIHILAEELKSLCNLEETVNIMTDPDESSSFLLELSSFLKELGCPYKRLITGHMSSRLQTKEDRLLLLDYMISELMAARMVNVDCAKDKPSSKMEIVVHESPTAKDLKDILIALKFNKPPPNITAEMLFSKLEVKLKDTIQKEGNQLVGKPLYNKSLTEKEWKQLETGFSEMFEEYRLRRETLITRLECTIQSFEWSDRLKSKKDVIQSMYRPKREQLKVKPDVRLSDFLAARTDLLQVEKTSSASVRKNTQSDVNKVIIGKVPDRGGRPNEQQPPPPEMPSWQQRTAAPQMATEIISISPTSSKATSAAALQAPILSIAPSSLSKAAVPDAPTQSIATPNPHTAASLHAPSLSKSAPKQLSMASNLHTADLKTSMSKIEGMQNNELHSGDTSNSAVMSVQLGKKQSEIIPNVAVDVLSLKRKRDDEHSDNINPTDASKMLLKTKICKPNSKAGVIVNVIDTEQQPDFVHKPPGSPKPQRKKIDDQRGPLLDTKAVIDQQPPKEKLPDEVKIELDPAATEELRKRFEIALAENVTVSKSAKRRLKIKIKKEILAEIMQSPSNEKPDTIIPSEYKNPVCEIKGPSNTNACELKANVPISENLTKSMKRKMKQLAKQDDSEIKLQNSAEEIEAHPTESKINVAEEFIKPDVKPHTEVNIKFIPTKESTIPKKTRMFNVKDEAAPVIAGSSGYSQQPLSKSARKKLKRKLQKEALEVNQTKQSDSVSTIVEKQTVLKIVKNPQIVQNIPEPMTDIHTSSTINTQMQMSKNNKNVKILESIPSSQRKRLLKRALYLNEQNRSEADLSKNARNLKAVRIALLEGKMTGQPWIDSIILNPQRNSGKKYRGTRAGKLVKARNATTFAQKKVFSHEIESQSQPERKRPKLAGLEPSTSSGSYISTNVKKDHLQVAIMTEPFEVLTAEQASAIEQAVEEYLNNEFLVNASTPSLRLPSFYDSPCYSEGVLKMYCEDDFSLNWLHQTVSHLSPRSESRLVVRSQSKIPINASMLVPYYNGEDLYTVRRALQLQNPWYNVENWTVKLSEQKRQNEGLRIELKIPKSDVERLLKRNKLVNYRLGSVFLQFDNEPRQAQVIAPQLDQFQQKNTTAVDLFSQKSWQQPPVNVHPNLVKNHEVFVGKTLEANTPQNTFDTSIVDRTQHKIPLDVPIEPNPYSQQQHNECSYATVGTRRPFYRSSEEAKKKSEQNLL